MTAVSLEQEPRPLLVGERINAQGSRKIKRLLLEERYDEIVLVAREQVEGGAHVLDVCCALTERADEDEQMRELVRRLAQSIEAPLVDRLDRTESARDRAAKLPRPRDRQLGASRSGPREDGRRLAAGARTRRGGRRADDRRERHGEDRRSASSKSRGASTRSRSASTVFRPAR